VMLLQPTSPLRTAEDIDAAIDVMKARQSAAVVSVCETAQRPAWMKRMAPDGELVNLLATADVTSRRQTLDPVYVLNGAIYLADRNVLLDRGSFYADKTYAYLMPPERSLDIDSAWDLRVAD